MNVGKINEKLLKNTDLVLELLESLGFENIKDTGNCFRFNNIGGDSPGAVAVYKDNLKYVNFSHGTRGNIISLVMAVKRLTLPSALNYIAKTLHLNPAELNQEVVYPFGGFYKQLLFNQSEPESTIKTYSEAELANYVGKYSTMFFKDGIGYSVQEKYKVGYDMWSNRITIPEYTFDGRLCGIMGRLNDTNCPHEERWLPIIPCSRNLTLFGYHRNYPKIVEKDLAIVFESEKAVMQLDTFGCLLGLSSCGNHLSSTQVRYLKSLMVKRIIVAYDEGLDEEYIREEAKKLLTDNQIYRNEVGYIYDKNHDILQINSKASPSDLGKVAFSELVKKYTVWL